MKVNKYLHMSSRNLVRNNSETYLDIVYDRRICDLITLEF